MRFHLIIATFLLPVLLSGQEALNFRVVYYQHNDRLIDSLPGSKNLALQFYECGQSEGAANDNTFSCMRVKWKNGDEYSVGEMQNIETDISDSYTPEGVLEKFVFDWYYSNTHDDETGKAKVWVTLWEKDDALLIELYAEFGIETVAMLGYLD